MSSEVIPRFGGGPVNGCDHLLFESKHVVFLSSTSPESILEEEAKKKSAERNRNRNIRKTGKNTVFIVIEFSNYSFEQKQEKDTNCCLMESCHQTFYCKLQNGRDRKTWDSWNCNPDGYYKAWHILRDEQQHYKDAYKCDCNNNHTTMTSILRYPIYTNLFIAQFIRSVFFIPVKKIVRLGLQKFEYRFIQRCH